MLQRHNSHLKVADSVLIAYYVLDYTFLQCCFLLKACTNVSPNWDIKFDCHRHSCTVSKLHRNGHLCIQNRVIGSLEESLRRQIPRTVTCFAIYKIWL